MCYDIPSSSDIGNTIECSQLLQMHFELIPHTYPSSPLLTTGVIESVNQFARSVGLSRPPAPASSSRWPWRSLASGDVRRCDDGSAQGGEGERANLLAMLAYKSSPSERERRPPSHTTPSIAARACARPPTRACQPSLARAHRAPLAAHSPRGPRCLRLTPLLTHAADGEALYRHKAKKWRGGEDLK